MLWFSFVLLCIVALVQADYKPASTSQTDKLFGIAVLSAAEYYKKNPPKTCNLKTVAVRREWSTLSLADRKSYTDAVNCLMKKPSMYSPTAVPGARSRFDDFVATHIKQTLTIHGTANFLSWHRYFTWAYEQALRNECGYKGYQPYWNWGKSAFDPIHSPYFDGSDGSMGGNGVYEAHNATEGLPTLINPIPPGVGGGCVKTGPFKNLQVNLGPVSSTLSTVPNQAGNGLNYNPRCLKRDISPWVSSRWNKDSDSFALINNNTDIYWFQTAMQGFFNVGDYGVHTGGHFTYLGDPAGDLFTSPGDPMFYLHHGQIDRTWWIWQNLDPKRRLSAISGTITLDNMPPSRNGTLEDAIDLEVNAAQVKIGDVMSTVEGPLCYIYV
ncbi:MAG: hypothetical protein MMC23_005883 [Stictis urceolatum]|nr:hypothetical protein [Stictis urceolata]